MSFPHQAGEDTAERTREILGCFGRGVELALKQSPLDRLRNEEERIVLERRFFFWEGYAFGLAGRHSIGGRPANPDAGRVIPHYRAMHYTGYGFWNGLAGLYRLPRFSLRPEDWRNVADFERLSPLIAGGIAFALASTEGALTDRVFERVGFPGNPVWRQGAVHGLGRSLWFLYMGDVERLEREFAARATLRDELCEGVGVAIAFTQLGTPDRILATIDGFGTDSRSRLMVGVAICLYQSVQDEPKLLPTIEGLREPRLRRAYDVCRTVMSSAETGPRWYSECAEGLRTALR
jgi:hypothetical protein